MLEVATTVESARVELTVKALDHVKVGFGLTQHLPHRELVRVDQQTNTAASTTNRFDSAQRGQGHDNFHQMTARDLVALRDFADRDRCCPIARGSAVDQHTQGVVSPFRKTHLEHS